MKRKIIEVGENNKKRKFGMWRLGIYFLVLFLGLFLISELWKGLTDSKWGKREQINFVYERNGKISYVRIDKKLEEIAIYNFSEDCLIELSNGYGSYKASKVKDLTEMEKIDLGQLLRETMTFYLGLLTDGEFVYLNEKKNDLKKIFINSFFYQNKTNFNRLDLVRMYFYVSGLRTEHLKEYDFAQMGFFEEKQLPDGSKVFELNKNIFDEYALTKLANTEYLEESLTWEVFNGTNYSGLGASFSRVISNNGFDLVGIRQSGQDYQKSFISLKEEEVSKSVKFLADYFGFEIKKDGILNDRADVVVVLGEDFYEKYY